MDTAVQGRAAEQKVMEIAMKAGSILLESGAEIFRVEETMERICKYYGVESGNSFILSNGIFLTAGNEKEPCYAKVKHIPVQGGKLDRVAAVNQLSREIEQGKYSLEQVGDKLNEIADMPAKTMKMQIFAAGISSACFCYMVGGDIPESAAAFAAGSILYLYVLKISRPYLSTIIGNILGGALITVLCILMYHLHIGSQMNQMIIGAIIPLVPGVAFTNGIRDIADGDYISGAVRMLDAGLVFLCIAAGVGFVITLYHMVTGGVML